MRSIGRRNIAKLNNIIETEYNKAKSSAGLVSAIDHVKLESEIKMQIPDEWYDIWESAWSEIERLISDKLSDLVYSKQEK